MRYFCAAETARQNKNASNGGMAFKAVLRNGAWVDDWADEGAAPGRMADTAIRVMVDVNGTLYAVDVAVTFGAKGRIGKFSK